MKKEKIIILHEYGANTHYKAVENLENVEIEYYEFALTKYTIKSIIRQDKKLFIKQIRNFIKLIQLCLTKNRKIILGMAPYDYRIYILNFILRNHEVYYHTSWSHWDESVFPKKLFYSKSLVKYWKSFLINKIKHIFSVTNFTKESLMQNMQIPASQISVVYHSFEDKIFSSTTEKLYDKESIKFIYVGRLTESKGVINILNLFKKDHMKNMTITFVGDGDLVPEIKKIVQEYKNILYPGYISDLKELATLYKNSNFILLPSIKQKNWEEVFGMVLIEAMACGTVPIASNHMGPSEIIQDKISGFIIPEDNFELSVETIIKNVDETYYYKLKEKAEKYSENFTLNNISKKWDLILNSNK